MGLGSGSFYDCPLDVCVIACAVNSSLCNLGRGILCAVYGILCTKGEPRVKVLCERTITGRRWVKYRPLNVCCHQYIVHGVNGRMMWTGTNCNEVDTPPQFVCMLCMHLM